MNIHYRILSKDDENHSMIVRYWTDIISEESLATELYEDGSPVLDESGHPRRGRTDYNLTLYNYEIPTDIQLHDIIVRNAPISFFKLLELRKTDPQKLDLSAVQSLIGVDRSFEITDSLPRIQSNVYGV